MYAPRAVPLVPRELFGKYLVFGLEHQTPEEDLIAMRLIGRLAKRQANGHMLVVEIGSWVGEGLVALACGALAERTMGDYIELRSVDTFEGTANDATGAIAQWYGGNIQALWDLNTRPLKSIDCGVTAYRMTSQEYCTHHLPKHDADLVFIDADHSRDGCTSDIIRFWETLKPGGWMAGHDYGSLFPGVPVAVDVCAQQLAGCSPTVINNTTVWAFQKPKP